MGVLLAGWHAPLTLSEPSIIAPYLITAILSAIVTNWVFYNARQSALLVELIRKTVWEAGADMARLSSNSTITPVERSGHFIQFDRPDVVVQVVQTVVAAIQHP
jgi:hypothetical protein